MSEIVDLKIEGMHCDACVRRVTALLKRVEGVEVGSVKVGAATVTLPAGMDRKEVEQAVENGGFQIAR